MQAVENSWEISILSYISQTISSNLMIFGIYYYIYIHQCDFFVFFFEHKIWETYFSLSVMTTTNMPEIRRIQLIILIRIWLKYSHFTKLKFFCYVVKMRNFTNNSGIFLFWISKLFCSTFNYEVVNWFNLGFSLLLSEVISVYFVSQLRICWSHPWSQPESDVIETEISTRRIILHLFRIIHIYIG